MSRMGRQRTAYLDWAATAPLCAEAAAAMAPYLQGGADDMGLQGNANSLHSVGRAAFCAMEDARAGLSRSLGCRPDELFFTGGATESDNTAVFGMVSAAVAARRARGDASFVPHVVTTAIEHEAVANPVKALERAGARVTFLAPDPRGFVSPDQVAAAAGRDTVLVSVMAANNEVGSVQPVEACARAAHAAGALFHTDAVQALGKVPFDCHALGVDAASFSAHKVGGPKGVGALYLKKGTPCEPYLLGGGQEDGMRSGTQNVAGMAGFAAAVRACCDPESLAAESRRLRALRDGLYAFLGSFAHVHATVPCAPGSADYLPNIVSVTVDGLESETAILRLDKAGVEVSGGSACSSKSLSPSHVLLQLGIGRDRALGALRVSMGRYTTGEDVDAFERAFRELMDWAGLD